MGKSEFYKRISDIQQELKAPKNQFNNFGKYLYRSCEDIIEGYKKLPYQIILTISDEVVMVGDRIYIKATATLTDGDNSISTTGMARESLTKKGMDDSQITGTASSYARKYALNGLFCIDDTKDADSMDNNQKPAQNKTAQKTEEVVNWYQDSQFAQEKEAITAAIRDGMPPDEVIKNLQDQGFAINKKIREAIKAI